MGSNGLLELCNRNQCIKKAPQKWQNEIIEEFDIAITFEKYVFDKVVDFMDSRVGLQIKPLIVININVQDSAEEAFAMGNQIINLCESLQNCATELEENIDSVLEAFENETERTSLYT